MAAAVRARGCGDRYQRASEAVEAIVNAQRPAWSDRARQIRAACREAIVEVSRRSGVDLAAEADLIFQVIAAGEERTRAFLWSIGSDPEEARRIVTEVRQAVDELSAVQAGGARRVA